MDVDEDGDSDASGTAPKKKAATKKVSTKDASEMYQKVRHFRKDCLRAPDSPRQVTQVEHVLKRPDTYIGSIEAQQQGMWVFDSANKSMVYR